MPHWHILESAAFKDTCPGPLQAKDTNEPWAHVSLPVGNLLKWWKRDGIHALKGCELS